MAVREFAYCRVYADDDGESHFEDVTVPMEPVDYAPPAAALDHAALGDAATLAVVGSDDAWDGETFHPPPARQFMLVLRGHGRVTVSDGASREFGPGDVFLFDDTRGKGHASKFFDECIVAAVRLAG
jgi:hypothetical protein